MYPVILTVHVLIGILLILVILIQSGRSGGFSNLMGGGGGDALFSTSGQQSGLRKVTVILAGMFMVTSLGLTLLSSRLSNRSVALQNFPSLPPVNVPTGNPSAGAPQAKDVVPPAVPEVDKSQSNKLDSTTNKK